MEMRPDYETVVEIRELIPLAIAMGLHGLFAALQFAIALFLVLSGSLLVRGGGTSVWLRRLGLPGDGRAATPGAGFLRIGLGGLLLLPLLAGAPTIVSFAACLVSLAVLLDAERTAKSPTGRITRLSILGAVAGVALFTAWEREDALVLGVALTTNMREWRVHELEWQYAKDVRAPKVGDLAPDFELQDPEGDTAVRLSDFRGTRPVVLVFGSYT